MTIVCREGEVFDQDYYDDVGDDGDIDDGVDDDDDDVDVDDVDVDDDDDDELSRLARHKCK